MDRIIDPHVHFISFNDGHYKWLQQSNPPYWPDKHKIAKSFSVEDCVFDSDTDLALEGIVHIEAGFDNNKPWREVEHIETLMASNSTATKIIAMVDLTLSPDTFMQQFERVSSYSSFAGVRHIFDNQMQKLSQNPRVNENTKLLQTRECLFELQTDLSEAEHASACVNWLEAHQHLPLVINHAGFAPELNTKAWRYWQETMLRLSQFENVQVKCSGFEMKNREYTDYFVSKVMEACAASFGVDRVLFASNFPLTKLSRSYSNYWLGMRQSCEDVGLHFHKQANENAKRLYNFNNLQA